MPSRSATEAVERSGAGKFVFLNYPFDDQYNPIFDALVFTVHACGFTVRCAKEDSGSDAIRIQKIVEIIRACDFGIHDLSRVDTQGTVAPIQMPLERHIYRCSRFWRCAPKAEEVFVHEGEPHQYHRFISDISGQDVRCHNNLPEEAVKEVRQWISDQVSTKKVVPGRDRILSFSTANSLRRYQDCYKWLARMQDR